MSLSEVQISVTSQYDVTKRSLVYQVSKTVIKVKLSLCLFSVVVCLTFIPSVLFPSPLVVAG